MRKVRMAVVLTTIMMLLAVICFADTDAGSATMDPVQQHDQIDQSAGASQEQSCGIDKGSSSANQADDNQTKEKPGPQKRQPAPRGPRGFRGPQGPQGPAGGIIIHEGHQGHGNALNLLHGKDKGHWNVVSGSYADARDQQTLEKANAYAKGLHDGQSPPPATGRKNKSHDRAGFPWWFWPLLILLALWILSRIFGGLSNFWRWLVVLFQRGTTATNTAAGRFRKRVLPTSTIKCFEGTGKLIEVHKAFCDLDGPNDCDWQWAPVGGELEVHHTPGGRLRFLVSVANYSAREIPTTPSMVISDLFESKNYHRVSGSGKIFAGETELGDLDDTFVERFISGNDVDLSKIIDKLPARDSSGVGRLNFVYEADEIDDTVQAAGGRVPFKPASTGPMFRLPHVVEPQPEAPPEPETPRTAEAPPETESAKEPGAAEAEEPVAISRPEAEESAPKPKVTRQTRQMPGVF